MLCPNCFNQTDSCVCESCNYNTKHEHTIQKALPAFTVLNARYLIGRVLGKGGFGITYIAQDLSNGQIVAIKECVPDQYVTRRQEQLVQVSGNSEEYRECIHCFVNEKNTLKSLSGVYGIVGFIDEFSENNTEYFVMEFVEGVTLKRLTTKSGGKLPLESSMYIFLMTGTILMNIHNRGIIHRDITPENIMISSDGNIKIIDFGAAKNFNAPSRDRTAFLKHGFAPPEQYNVNGHHGYWTDVYSLGATFYTIVSGQPLIDSKIREERDTMKSLYALECGIPRDMSDFIARSLALDEEYRYASVEDFFSYMEKYSYLANGGLDPSLMSIVNRYHISESRRTVNGRSVYSGSVSPCVEVVSGKSAGERIKIPEYGFISIGKDPELVELALSDSNGISRRHCIVGYDRSKDKFIVIDRSTNGTLFSNGTRMMTDAETYLESGEMFYVLNEDIGLRVTFE